MAAIEPPNGPLRLCIRPSPSPASAPACRSESRGRSWERTSPVPTRSLPGRRLTPEGVLCALYLRAPLRRGHCLQDPRNDHPPPSLYDAVHAAPTHRRSTNWISRRSCAPPCRLTSPAAANRSLSRDAEDARIPSSCAQLRVAARTLGVKH